ncbi:hypothetical protein GCM10009733_022180 [Nonomuraea maheshkhaliensis]|uniref:Transposase n=2 Tax=Nonomuraea maheshkhaliensis TaxID=419590 RepID=A0ABN2F189_9ACTN
MVGRVRFKWTEDLPGVAKNFPAGQVAGARLVKDVFGWSIVFRAETLVQPAAPHQGEQVGIDRGVTVAPALSDGTMREHGPWLTGREAEHLRRLEKEPARQRAARPSKTRPSGREQRTYDQIARLRAKAERRAVDWQHQTTTELVGTFSVIKVEKLAILNMVESAKGTIEAPGRNVAQKAGLNRSISGQAWGRTVTLLVYESADRGGQVVKVPAPGTSQTCHRCGHRDPASRNGTVPACVNPVCGSAMPTPTPRSTSTTPRGLRCQDVETSASPGLRSVNPRAPLDRDATGEPSAFKPGRRSQHHQRRRVVAT